MMSLPGPVPEEQEVPMREVEEIEPLNTVLTPSRHVRLFILYAA